MFQTGMEFDKAGNENLRTNMDTFICNKCFATKNRGKQPFCLTQCGHIFCNGCKQKAQKQCPQCQQMDIFSVELQQPSLSKVENFFAPLSESLESLHKICGFQCNQIKIMVRRFHEIDQKYETLKTHYYNHLQNMKLMREKYMKLKMEFAEQRKKFKSIEMHNRTLNSSMDMCTPKSSNNPRNGRNTASTNFSSCGPSVSCHTINTEKQRRMFEGFRVPQPKSTKLIGSRDASQAHCTYTFRP